MNPEFHAEMNACREAVERDISKMMDDHIRSEEAKYQQIHSQLTEVQQQLDDIAKLFEQGKGVLTAIKIGGYIFATVWALLIWGKDHLRF